LEGQEVIIGWLRSTKSSGWALVPANLWQNVTFLSTNQKV
jgi:hypothetical protein